MLCKIILRDKQNPIMMVASGEFNGGLEVKGRTRTLTLHSILFKMLGFI